ncbi:unnamed protein product, partial [Adineta steineri]
MLSKLNLDHKSFFDCYQGLFTEKIKQKFYEFPHIARLLRSLGSRDDLFGAYFSAYSAYTSPNEVWNMFLYLSSIGDLNEIMQKHLILILPPRIDRISTEDFKQYTKLAKDHLTQISDEKRPPVLKILETVLYAFLNKQLHDDQYSYKFTESDLKEFLNTSLEFSASCTLENSSYLLIIRHLLFK